MDASSNVDGKSRGGLGPRLKSYLSSNNLFGLNQPGESDHEVEQGDGWPSLNPVYDGTTTTSDQTFDRWISALRYRLWKYDDVPLGTEYNAPILWLTEQCIKVSKENKRLKAALLELSSQNQELLRTRTRSSSSIHRPSNSLPNGAFSGWKESPQRPHAKHRSISFSDEATRVAAKALIQGNAGRTIPVEQGTSPAVAPLDPYTARSRKANKNVHDENDDSDPYQPTTSQLANARPEFAIGDINGCQTDAKNNLEALAATSGQNFPSTSGISRPTSSYQNLQSFTNPEEAQRADHRRRKSSGSITLPTRRVFSFCPGDDQDVLESFAEYSRQQQQQQQQPDLHNVDQYFGPSTAETKQPVETAADHIQNRRDLSVSRDTSTSSVVTVVKASERKKARSKIPDRENKKAQEQNTSEETGRETVPAERPQGPLAAALAATARFGKGGRRR